MPLLFFFFFKLHYWRRNLLGFERTRSNTTHMQVCVPLSFTKASASSSSSSSSSSS
jgi:hypothetical protein